MPRLDVQVCGHSVIGKHTYYHLDCTLVARPGGGEGPAFDDASWQCAGRLKHIRSGLHDLAKRELGSKYKMLFSGKPFAQRMRPAGTTARLELWCKCLAHCVSVQLLRPSAVASTLRFLGIPEPGAPKDGHLGVIVEESSVSSVGPKTGPPAAGGGARDAGDGRDSDAELDDMLASLSAAESSFGLSGLAPGDLALPFAGDGAAAAASSAAAPGWPASAALAAETGEGAGSVRQASSPVSASDPTSLIDSGSEDSDRAGGGEEDGHGGGPGMLRLSPPINGAPESKLQAMLRARREVVDSQAMSGRGKLF